MSADGWIPLDEATGAFERPAWAIRALLEQGKLERKVEEGRVYVRKPVARTARTESSVEGLAVSLGEFLPADSFVTGDDGDSVETRAFPMERAAAAALPATESWDDIRADVDELMRKTRARDALLARAAHALLFVEAGMRQAPPALPLPAPRRSLVALSSALILGLVLAGSVSAKLALDAVATERLATGRALERAAAIERERAADRALASAAPIATIAPSAPVAPVGTAARPEVAVSVSQGTTLPAGFNR